MSSPHFSKLATLLVLATAAAAVGCASSGSKDARPRGDSGVAMSAEREPLVTPEARTLYEQATAIMGAGDLIDAELRFKEFLLQYPAFPGAHVNLAIIHAQRNDDQAARAAVDAALALDPDFAPALNQLGVLLRKSGDFAEAEAAYLKAVTASPDYALAHYNLGVLNELYLQRLDEALQHFERYQELAGSDEEVDKWISDLRRRVSSGPRAANVSE